jgi:hypothetical protein
MRLGAALSILSVLAVVCRSPWITFWIPTGSRVVLNEGFAEPLAFTISSALVEASAQTVLDRVRGHRGLVL